MTQKKMCGLLRACTAPWLHQLQRGLAGAVLLSPQSLGGEGLREVSVPLRSITSGERSQGASADSGESTPFSPAHTGGQVK